MRSYLPICLVACALVCLVSGSAFASPGEWGHHHSAPAPFLGAGIPGALTVAAAAMASYLRRSRKSRKG